MAEEETLEHQAIRKPDHNVANMAPNFARQMPPTTTSPSAMFLPPPPQMPTQYPGVSGPYPQPLVPMPGTTSPPGQYQYGLAQSRPASPFAGQQWQPAPARRPRVPIWARIALFIMLVLMVTIGAFAGYYYYTLSTPISSIVNQQVPRLKGDDNPNQVRGNGGNILNGGRINILLLGSDTDQKFTNADGSHTYLAQTDIVVTIDPATKSVAMLSIPRDFWINIPGAGMHKLDEAYALGGIALSRLTIAQDFGIHINYYAWVGLDGFVKVIDTVNGVDVDVLHPITDDEYPDDVGNHTTDIYRYKRLYIAPGPQHLSGRAALEYVRSRHADFQGDFGRSVRQQQVLTQLKNKLNNSGVIEKLPELANDLNGYVKTDMQLNEVFDLMRLARGINTSKIKRITLGPPYSSVGNAPGGVSVVLPHCDLIVPVIAQLFGSSADPRCNITANNNSTASSLASQVSPGSHAITQTTSQVVNISTMSLNGGTSDLLGIHSLLELLLLIVFESPAALQA